MGFSGKKKRKSENKTTPKLHDYWMPKDIIAIINYWFAQPIINLNSERQWEALRLSLYGEEPDRFKKQVKIDVMKKQWVQRIDKDLSSYCKVEVKDHESYDCDENQANTREEEIEKMMDIMSARLNDAREQRAKLSGGIFLQEEVKKEDNFSDIVFPNGNPYKRRCAESCSPGKDVKGQDSEKFSTSEIRSCEPKENFTGTHTSSQGQQSSTDASVGNAPAVGSPAAFSNSKCFNTPDVTSNCVEDELANMHMITTKASEVKPHNRMVLSCASFFLLCKDDQTTDPEDTLKLESFIKIHGGSLTTDEKLITDDTIIVGSKNDAFNRDSFRKLDFNFYHPEVVYDLVLSLRDHENITMKEIREELSLSCRLIWHSVDEELDFQMLSSNDKEDFEWPGEENKDEEASNHEDEDNEQSSEKGSEKKSHYYYLPKARPKPAQEVKAGGDMSGPGSQPESVQTTAMALTKPGPGGNETEDELEKQRLVNKALEVLRRKARKIETKKLGDGEIDLSNELNVGNSDGMATQKPTKERGVLISLLFKSAPPNHYFASDLAKTVHEIYVQQYNGQISYRAVYLKLLRIIKLKTAEKEYKKYKDEFELEDTMLENFLLVKSNEDVSNNRKLDM